MAKEITQLIIEEWLATNLLNVNLVVDNVGANPTPPNLTHIRTGWRITANGSLTVDQKPTNLKRPKIYTEKTGQC